MQAAERYLQAALDQQDQLNAPTRAAVHRTLAWLLRIFERLDWTVVTAEDPHPRWGALRHYHRALTL